MLTHKNKMNKQKHLLKLTHKNKINNQKHFSMSSQKIKTNKIKNLASHSTRELILEGVNFNNIVCDSKFARCHPHNPPCGNLLKT